jgi:transposase-like protein
MDFDAEKAIGAARHERSADRITYRNGFRDRTLETRVGLLDLKIPKFRTGQSYSPGFVLEPRRLMDFVRSEIDPGDRFPDERRAGDIVP